MSPSSLSTHAVCAVAVLAAGVAAWARQAEAPPVAEPRVWSAAVASFDDPGYRGAVAAAFAAWEADAGRVLAPGPRGSVALKTYTASGAGLATPRALVRAVVEELVARGFAREAVFLVDLQEHRLRQAGFLPALSERAETFEGLRVVALERGAHYDPRWYYDSALPDRMDLSASEAAIVAERLGEAEGEDRRSLLAAPLLFDVDFWINLPVGSDHPAFGVNGALANATVWNASNTLRFLRTPATAPAAIAEMAAIPELRSTWVLTLLTLERYQFVGGPVFNSYYTVSEPELLVSDNPVAIDAVLLQRIDRARRAVGFAPVSEGGRLLTFAEQLGLGLGFTVPPRVILAAPQP